MGFDVPDSMKIVLQADSNQIRYRTSLPPLNKVDTVDSYLGPATDRDAARAPTSATVHGASCRRGQPPGSLHGTEGNLLSAEESDDLR
jgi:hypothetical protein